MKHGDLPDFIVIDDDYINNVICDKMIQLTMPGANVVTFTEPEKGLEHILATYSGIGENKAILFLDINMPSLNGWEVLDRFAGFSEEVKNRVKIIMLSSSIDPLDKEKALKNPLVSEYVIKSLSRVKLRTLFPQFVK